MKEKAISVTEAARNFADCINRVRYQGMTIILLKNGTPVARLVQKRRSAVGTESGGRTAEFDLSPKEAPAGIAIFGGTPDSEAAG